MAKGKKTGGRQAGTPNKITAEVRSIAQEYGREAVAQLAHLMVNGENETVRLAAAKEMLDRAYGRAGTVVEYREMDKEIERAEQAAAYAKTPEGKRDREAREAWDALFRI